MTEANAVKTVSGKFLMDFFIKMLLELQKNKNVQNPNYQILYLISQSTQMIFQNTCLM